MTASIPESYFSTAAQVIPTVVIAMVIELRAAILVLRTRGGPPVRRRFRKAVPTAPPPRWPRLLLAVPLVVGFTLAAAWTGEWSALGALAHPENRTEATFGTVAVCLGIVVVVTLLLTVAHAVEVLAYVATGNDPPLQ